MINIVWNIKILELQFAIPHESTLHLFPTQVHKGVRGVVRDKSGKPIVGAIIVLNGGVRVFTAEGGYFHALLAPGNHNIEAVADGYQQQHKEVHPVPWVPHMMRSKGCIRL